ncbi:MAG: helix-turn-helix domain-containing protein [Myxococcales bacterium]|nr:helix-turn-helix domain-containing protein [Myxococcales bacterium]
MAGDRRATSAARDPLTTGRVRYGRHEWRDAHEALRRADSASPLGRDDLDRLATAAMLIGNDETMFDALERLFHAHVAADAPREAARAAFWLGFRLVATGATGRAGGWFARARRLIEETGAECAEQGYLLLPEAARALGAGDLSGAQETAARAAEIGVRCQDADLAAFARQMEGRALLRQGATEGGIALLDESMLAVANGEVSPLVTGLVYCSVIATCQQCYVVDRALEWTTALSAWCAAEPQVEAFTGPCLVHRSELLLLEGRWAEAVAEVTRARATLSEATDAQTLAAACYQQGELHRLRGELADAEQAYRAASALGLEPQPGLARLRLSQGQRRAAARAIGRMLATTTQPWRRPHLLLAAVEIFIAAGETGTARSASRELDSLAERFGTAVLPAMAAQARGALCLASDEPDDAVEPLRGALEVWRGMGACYAAARIRALLARACLALGDTEGAALEEQAAREVFEELGAACDLAALDAGETAAAPALVRDLSARELEVLRLLATGKTNRAIARALCVSPRTIDRHVSHIFVKIGVRSRAAATAFAYEHALV